MEEHRERLNLEMTFEIMMERLKMVDLNFVCVFYGLYVHLQKLLYHNSLMLPVGRLYINFEPVLTDLYNSVYLLYISYVYKLCMFHKELQLRAIRCLLRLYRALFLL